MRSVAYGEVAVPDTLYYRQQAERFDRVADQCSIASLVPYYRKMAFDYLTRAVRAEAASEQRAAKNADKRANVPMRSG